MNGRNTGWRQTRASNVCFPPEEVFGDPFREAQSHEHAANMWNGQVSGGRVNKCTVPSAKVREAEVAMLEERFYPRRRITTDTHPRP